MLLLTEVTKNIFQVYEEEVQKYPAGAEMVKPQNKLMILEEFSLNSWLF